MELTIAQVRAASDLDLGASEWFPIDQDRIDAFAEATEDRQWIHIDPERAAESPFGSTIAHGYLLVALIPRLFTEIFEVPEAEMLVNYGIDKVRFIKPVPSGSRVRLEATLVTTIARRDNLMLRIRGNLVLESGGRAMIAETLFLVVPPDTEA
ncbi:MAG: MaoC family dehydratase [Acidobacteriota bacterium]